ncbi:MAG: hypothetical protein N3B68_06520 [Anaerolineae bacterium]|nr:hypothetical protein [Anaerolineae bacterium]
MKRRILEYAAKEIASGYVQALGLRGRLPFPSPPCGKKGGPGIG